MTENYADPVDRASVEEQRSLELAIQAARGRSEKVLPCVGTCYNCDESVEAGHRFCDADCRDDYEKRIKRK